MNEENISINLWYFYNDKNQLLKEVLSVCVTSINIQKKSGDVKECIFIKKQIKIFAKSQANNKFQINKHF